MIIDLPFDSKAPVYQTSYDAGTALPDFYHNCSGPGNVNRRYYIQNMDHFGDTRRVLSSLIDDIKTVKSQVKTIFEILKANGSVDDVNLVTNEISSIFMKNLQYTCFDDESEIVIRIQTGTYMDHQEDFTAPISPGYLGFRFLESEESFEMWLQEYDRISEGLNFALGKGEALLSRIDYFDRFYEYEKKYNDHYQRKSTINSTSCFDHQRELLSYSAYSFSTALQIVGRIRDLTERNIEDEGEDSVRVGYTIYELLDELDRIASHAVFNGQNFLTGRYSGQLEVFESGMNLVTGDTIDDIKAKKLISINAASLLALPVPKFSESGGYWSINLMEKINDPVFVEIFLDVLDKAEIKLLNQLTEVSAMLRELPDSYRAKELVEPIITENLIPVDINQCLSESGLTLKPGSPLFEHMISLFSAADSGCNQIISDLLLLREYALIASNSVYSEGDRRKWQQETQVILNRIDFVARNTRFNGRPLFKKGSLLEYIQLSGVLKTPIQLSFSYPDTESLGLKAITASSSAYNLSTSSQANLSIGKLDQALTRLFHYKQILYTALLYANINNRAETLLNLLEEEAGAGGDLDLTADSILSYCYQTLDLARNYYLTMGSSVYSWEKGEFERHARMLIFCTSDLLARSAKKIGNSKVSKKGALLKELSLQVQKVAGSAEEANSASYIHYLNYDARTPYNSLSRLLTDIEKLIKKPLPRPDQEDSGPGRVPPEKETEINETGYNILTGQNMAVLRIMQNNKEIALLEHYSKEKIPYIGEDSIKLYKEYNHRLFDLINRSWKKSKTGETGMVISLPLGRYLLDFPVLTSGTVIEWAELLTSYRMVYRIQYEYRENALTPALEKRVRRGFQKYRALSRLYGEKSVYSKCCGLLSKAIPGMETVL